MKKQRYHIYNDPTIQPRAQFMNLIQDEPCLSSEFGFMVMDIDCHIRNYHTEKHALIEIKCKNRPPQAYQQHHIVALNKSLSYDPDFRGTFMIVHEKLGFDDGWTNLYKYSKDEKNWVLIWNKFNPEGHTPKWSFHDMALYFAELVGNPYHEIVEALKYRYETKYSEENLQNV